MQGRGGESPHNAPRAGRGVSSSTPGAPETRRLPHLAAGSVELPFRIHGGQETISRDTRWAEHSHPTHELLWSEQGASTASVDGRVWTITASFGLWIPAGVVHSGFTPAGLLLRAAHFSPSRVEAPAEVPAAVDITPLLRLLLDRLITEELSEHSQAVTEAMILDVLVRSPYELPLPIPDHPLLDPIVEAERSIPAEPVSLESWAQRLGVSSRTLTRTFEATTGMTFRDWSATARAQHALSLLTRDLSTEEVAQLVGYRSASAFTAAFRRVTGLTPGQYRRRLAGPAPSGTADEDAADVPREGSRAAE